MKRAIGKLALVATIFLLGGLSLPVLIAAGGAAFTSKNKEDRFFEARRLIAVYQTHLPRNILFLSINSDGGASCGYDPEKLAPETTSKADRERYTDELMASITGERWWVEEQDDIWLSDIADRISNSNSAFTVSFLRRCIEGTALRPLCISHVSQLDQGVEYSPKKLDLRRAIAKRAYCTFVDGVAAKRGIPLVDHSTELTASSD